MRDLSIKLKCIYLRYLLIAIGFILFYSLIRWYLDYKLNILHLKEDLFNFWIPFGLPFIPIVIWLRREIRCLNLNRRSTDGYFVYQFVAAMTMFVPTLIAQEYIEALHRELVTVQSVSEITTAKSTDCYILDDFKIIKSYTGKQQVARTSGKNNEDLHFNTYFVVPLVDKSIHLNANSHKYWCGVKYTENMSNFASNASKNRHWTTFYKKCVSNFEKHDFHNHTYLQGLSLSDDRDGYIEAIKAKQKNVDTENLIILEPIDEPFDKKLGTKFGWIFGSFGIGAALFLIMILIPSIDKNEFKRYIENKPLQDDDLKLILKFLVPSGKHFVTAILIDINLLIFIFLVLSGFNFISATPHELLEVGANRRFEVMNGETWRLFTSLFLHGGAIHILGNLFGIGLTCSLIEPILGRWRTLLAYIITGIGASIASIYWHENSVSVGASGAIFGMMGIMIALMVTKKDNGFGGIYYIILGLYGGITLLFGVLGGVDNAAHIGGLLTGIVVGLILILTNWNHLAQVDKRT